MQNKEWSQLFWIWQHVKINVLLILTIDDAFFFQTNIADILFFYLIT